MAAAAAAAEGTLAVEEAAGGEEEERGAHEGEKRKKVLCPSFFHVMSLCRLSPRAMCANVFRVQGVGSGRGERESEAEEGRERVEKEEKKGAERLAFFIPSSPSHFRRRPRKRVLFFPSFLFSEAHTMRSLARLGLSALRVRFDDRSFARRRTSVDERPR